VVRVLQKGDDGMKCFYHDDLDGRCAAFWVHQNAGVHVEPDGQTRIEFLPINYKDPFPMGSIQYGEQVWIVDYSIQPDEMRTLLSITDDVTWIDHHKTAIEKYADFDLAIRGVRHDGIAACVLTFVYLHHMTARGNGDISPFDKSMLSSKPVVPMFTLYIGDRDVWEWKYGEETRNFYAGFMLEDTTPQSDMWGKAIQADPDTSNWQEIGSKVEAAKRRTDAEFLATFGFETEFEGHKAIACNQGRTSSDLFASVKGKYSLMIPFVFDGTQYTVSLYSTEIDVSEIAKKYGGGGHLKAAGFQCLTLPFAAIS